jgi:hypothetical protein
MTLADAIDQAVTANEQKVARTFAPRPVEPDAKVYFEQFQRFCSEHGVRSLPAAPAVVAAFIRDGGIEPAKLTLILAAIEQIHDHHNLANPVATSVVREQLSLVLKVEPPRSWTKDEKLIFTTLPIEVQASVGRRERERETEMRRAQNAAAEAKKRHAGADEPATQPQKEDIQHVNS